MREPSPDATAEALRALTQDPPRGAVFSDIDGTLAPIVSRPEDARVDPRISQLIGQLARSYACVACISGRPAAEARRLVGRPEIVYAGLHGAELLRPGEARPRLARAWQPWKSRVRRFGALQAGSNLHAAGVRIEDKGPILAFHWRGAADETDAVARLKQVADAATDAGLTAHWGRKVLEVRPPVAIGKGQAIRDLVAHSHPRAALYGGDDATDLDGFDALDGLVAEGALRTAIRVGVASAEGPPEISERADLVVDSVDGFAAVLEGLLPG
jgi:trehalose 6-phosphate phosphatase